MIDSFTFIKDYRENITLRASFNDLAASIFGINFEAWCQFGFWTSKYMPYSFIKDNQVIANASVNLIDFVINKEVKRAVQIGTVMTHPDYRNFGLARKLMERIIKDYEDVDFLYLFANQSVLDFYPKFGFTALKETQYSMSFDGNVKDDQKVKKLHGGNREDLRFIYEFSQSGKMVSDIFDTTNTNELLMFYCMYVFPDDLYSLQSEEAIVLCKHEGSMLHIFDVISAKEPNLKVIIAHLANGNTRDILFYFTPDRNIEGLTTAPYQDSNTLFMKYNHKNVSLPTYFKHPITSQA
ncbi:GNAT family N-acetyltransferase [Neobacillus soli]|uniref:GNAT family N-acetyltransferase n=1 Tax=Neobacillus soli TaxID=220688 RepID=UPI0008262296|nr:GNAT family N-acetyltransferase [Neobacillus soli]